MTGPRRGWGGPTVGSPLWGPRCPSPPRNGAAQRDLPQPWGTDGRGLPPPQRIPGHPSGSSLRCAPRQRSRTRGPAGRSCHIAAGASPRAERAGTWLMRKSRLNFVPVTAVGLQPPPAPDERRHPPGPAPPAPASCRLPADVGTGAGTGRLRQRGNGATFLRMGLIPRDVASWKAAPDTASAVTPHPLSAPHARDRCPWRAGSVQAGYGTALAPSPGHGTSTQPCPCPQDGCAGFRCRGSGAGGLPPTLPGLSWLPAFPPALCLCCCGRPRPPRPSCVCSAPGMLHRETAPPCATAGTAAGTTAEGNGHRLWA